MKYAIGIDYGTLSARGLLVEVATGRVAAEAECPYPHQVMDETHPDPDGRLPQLPRDYALQDAEDYLAALKELVRRLVSKITFPVTDIIAIGIDATSCTLLPVSENLLPLSANPELSHNPHAYAKLWKHHSATKQARKVTDLAKDRQEPWLPFYGGEVSCEWVLPKVMEILEEAPAIYDKAAYFIEEGDFIVSHLIGKPVISHAMAGYKALYHDTYPGPDFTEKLLPGHGDFHFKKLALNRIEVGEAAGIITEEWARELGLSQETVVTTALIDAHASLLGAGITEPGHLLLVLGTSSCAMLLSREHIPIPGICGSVRNGILPGFYGYEAGQPSTGDTLQWFLDTMVPAAYPKEAEEKGVFLHRLLTQKAMTLQAGASGLLALDWWNGNRSTLIDSDLSGLILGLSNGTKPEEIYRALIESQAFGARKILENFTSHGIPINRVTLAGGIARKNSLVCQIYASVLGRPVAVSGVSDASALGAAMMAVSCGIEYGGWETAAEAVQHMRQPDMTTIQPDPDDSAVYEALYAEWSRLYDLLGKKYSDIMRAVKRIRRSRELIL